MYDLQNIRLTINGVEEETAAKPYATLLDVMRDQLGHIEVKEGCAVGDCGACAVLLDGVAACSCLVLARQADGAQIVTAAGIGTPDHLHPLQEAFMDYGGIQCGFCTPGLIISSKALLDENPHPTRQDVKVALSGNFCRCTGYEQVIESVLAAAEKMGDSHG
jgi:aerobic-type carbon monoxide dehydrogenase small subunit (CoxS/CutS family)